MALFTKQRRRQQFLIGILGLVVLVTVGVLVFGFLRGEPAPSVVTPPDTTPSLPRLMIPAELFSEDTFRNFSPYTPITLPSDIGKSNPFSP